MKLTDTDLVLIDAMNLLWRAAHTTGELGFETENGWKSTGAVYGFLASADALLRQTGRVDVIVVWEGSRGDRRAILPEYKADRDEPDEKLARFIELVISQAKMLRGILKHTSWGQLRAPNWEADDAMVTAAAAARRAGLRVLVYSNDADLLQALDDGVAIYKATTKKDGVPLWTVERLRDEWGVAPWQVPHVKALAGDKSDCYKGAQGIGDVWACKLIAEHGTIEGVIEAARKGELTPAKSKAVVEGAEYVRKCLQVAQLRSGVKTRLKWGEPDEAKLNRIFYSLRFGSISARRFVQ